MLTAIPQIVLDNKEVSNQTVFVNFSENEVSRDFFHSLGGKYFGNIDSEGRELIASIFISRINLLRAFLGAVSMLGAIFSPIFVFGIEVQK